MKTKDIEYEAFLDAANKHAKKIGVKKVAARYGCSPTHIYQVLNRDKNAGRDVQLKLAKACGFETLSEFLGMDLTPPDKDVNYLRDKIQWLESSAEHKDQIIEAKELAYKDSQLLREKEAEGRREAEECLLQSEDIIRQLLRLVGIMEELLDHHDLPWIKDIELAKAINTGRRMTGTDG